MPPARRRKTNKSKQPTLTGLQHVDALALASEPLLQDYIDAVSQYVREAAKLTVSQAKTAQIALSSGLGRCLREELIRKVPRITPHAGEVSVAGALRTARADVSESHELDGLRLAVEIKPVNLAVGRAIWNRFGDVRAFAVNVHLKFPFAVVGGVLVIPEWEWAKVTRTMVKDAKKAAAGPQGELPQEFDQEELPGDEDVDESAEAASLASALMEEGALYKKSTTSLLDRLVVRLQRTRRRETEADAAHLLEGVAVIVYNPDTAKLHPTLPPVASGLRWDEFVRSLAETYDVRFE